MLEDCEPLYRPWSDERRASGTSQKPKSQVRHPSLIASASIQAGILLKLPRLTITTASVFFYRFFMRSSMYVEKGGSGALHHYIRPSPSPTTSSLSLPTSSSLPRPKFHCNLKARNPSLTSTSSKQNIAAYHWRAVKNPSLTKSGFIQWPLQCCLQEYSLWV